VAAAASASGRSLFSCASSRCSQFRLPASGHIASMHRSGISEFDIHGRGDQTLLRDQPIAAQPADSPGVLEADQVIEPIDLGKALVAESTLVVIERVNDNLFCAAIRVIRGIYRRRRADLVHKPN
jgi:hypothetical protein